MHALLPGSWDKIVLTCLGTQQTGEPCGTNFLSARAPWTCSVCKVTCTSRETLLGHAAGAKHKRRVRDIGMFHCHLHADQAHAIPTYNV